MPASPRGGGVATCPSRAPRNGGRKPPERATCSSMWSRNGSPVATLTRPRPSSTTFAVSCVSLLLRTTSADLLKAHLHRMCVGGQSLQRREPHGRVAKHLEIAAVQAQDAAALEERVHPQGRRKPCRP